MKTLMFERFSEPARRAIFFARFEAGHLGSETIEPEHLLLGVLQEDQSRKGPAFFSPECAENLRRIIRASLTPGDEKPEGVDMLLADACVRALLAAQEYAPESTVGLLHVLLALISDPDNSVQSVLLAQSVTAKQIQDAIGL